MINQMSFLPDWTSVWTIKEAERQLRTFKFKGPGWYHGGSSSDTLLVVPIPPILVKGELAPVAEVGDDPWKKTWPPETRFNFHVYNGRDPSSAFDAVTKAPLRYNVRKRKKV